MTAKPDRALHVAFHGDMDILSGSTGDTKVAWYENDGNQSFVEHVISTTTAAYGVTAADIESYINNYDKLLAPAGTSPSELAVEHGLVDFSQRREGRLPGPGAVV